MKAGESGAGGPNIVVGVRSQARFTAIPLYASFFFFLIKHLKNRFTFFHVHIYILFQILFPLRLLQNY